MHLCSTQTKDIEYFIVFLIKDMLKGQNRIIKDCFSNIYVCMSRAKRKHQVPTNELKITQSLKLMRYAFHIFVEYILSYPSAIFNQSYVD